MGAGQSANDVPRERAKINFQTSSVGGIGMQIMSTDCTTSGVPSAGVVKLGGRVTLGALFAELENWLIFECQEARRSTQVKALDAEDSSPPRARRI